MESIFCVRQTKGVPVNFDVCANNKEVCKTNINRYCRRIGLLKLLLSQFSKDFDYVGKEKSLSLFKIYYNSDIEIPFSQTLMITNEENNEKKYLPEYILIENGDVLKLRKRSKMLVYPNFKKGTREYNYSMTMLFWPFKTESELQGIQMTKVEEIKLKVFPMFNNIKY